MTDHEDIRKALDALNETEFTVRCYAVDHLTWHAPQWLAGLLAECDGLRARVAMLDSLLAPLQAAAQHAVADLDFALVGMRLADALPLMREAHDEALARAELAETKHASCEAHLRLVTEERERLADQREDWRARSIANEERAEAAERERDDALRDVEHIHARASRAESDRAEVAKERASLRADVEGGRMTKEDRETSDPMTIDEIETLLANATEPYATALRYLLDRVREVERADYASIRFAMDQSAEHRADIAATVADRDEWKRRAEAAERERDEPRGFAVVSDADHPDTLRRRLADTEAKWKADVQRLITLVESLTKERDTLKRHYDSAAPEHNLAALLDLYDEQRRDAILALEAACEGTR